VKQGVLRAPVSRHVLITGTSLRNQHGSHAPFELRRRRGKYAKQQRHQKASYARGRTPVLTAPPLRPEAQVIQSTPEVSADKPQPKTEIYFFETEKKKGLQERSQTGELWWVTSNKDKNFIDVGWLNPSSTNHAQGGRKTATRHRREERGEGSVREGASELNAEWS